MLEIESVVVVIIEMRRGADQACAAHIVHHHACYVVIYSVGLTRTTTAAMEPTDATMSSQLPRSEGGPGNQVTRTGAGPDNIFR